MEPANTTPKTTNTTPGSAVSSEVVPASQKIPTHEEVARYSRRHRNDDGFAHVLLFYVLPFIVLNAIIFFLVTSTPKFTIEAGSTENYLTTQVVLTVDSHFPIRSVEVTLDGEELALEQSARRTYIAPINKNGVLEATVINKNGMSLVQYEHVDVLDDTPPVFDEAIVDNGVVTLMISDSQSGLNFDSVYALDSAGELVTPISADPLTDTFSFAIDPDGLYVHAQDWAGNEVQGTFTSHMEGTELSEGTDVEL